MNAAHTKTNPTYLHVANLIASVKKTWCSRRHHFLFLSFSLFVRVFFSLNMRLCCAFAKVLMVNFHFAALSILSGKKIASLNPIHSEQKMDEWKLLIMCSLNGPEKYFIDWMNRKRVIKTFLHIIEKVL